MNKRASKYCFLFLTSFALVSCESYIDDVKLPEFEKKLTIFGFLNPEDTISYISVGVNQSLFGELSRQPLPGVVSGTISDGDREIIPWVTNNWLRFRNSDFPIGYGKTYKIKVSNDEGLNLEATCTIPEKRQFRMTADTFSVISPYMYPDRSGRSVDFNFRFTDIAGEKNFYRVLAKARTYYTNPVNGKKFRNSTELGVDKDFISDAGKDGNEIISKTNYGMNYFFAGTYDSVFVTFFLLNTEESYFLYHNSLQKYTSGENPFTEVTPVYSNVTGGLGVFTSYTIDSLVYRIK